MGLVGVLYKIYPKENEAATVAERLKSLKPASVQSEEIGFGIIVVKAFFTFEDKGKVTSAVIEEQIRKLEGVSEVEVMEESLL